MTAPDKVSGGIDQIVFTWSDRLLTGGSGLGPVASSLDPNELARWSALLEGGAIATGQWLQGAAKCVALGALRVGRKGDLGAVLRLMPDRDPYGHSTQAMHALVGKASVVNAELALGLHNWPGWITPDMVDNMVTTLQVRSAVGLREYAARQLDALTAPREPLAALLAGVLAAPDRAYLAALAPDDYGLVAGLVRRMAGLAGPEPWTIMLGATVTREEARPRLLVLDLPDAGRGRTPLAPDAVAVQNLARAGRLLAGMPPASLNPPPTPLTDTAKLLAWVEAEHQRTAGVLDLIDAALGGTLDEQDRRRLESAAGAEELRAELRSVDPADLAVRLERWPAAPPPGLAGIGRTLRRVAVQRALTDVRAALQAAERLINAACDMGVTPEEASGVLADWRARSPDITPTQRLAGVYVALRLEINPASDGTADDLLSGLAPRALLEWSTRLTTPLPPEVALRAIRAAYARWRRSHGRTGDPQVRELLRTTGLLHETVREITQHRYDRTEVESELYRILLLMAFGDEVGDVGDVGAILSMLPPDAPATAFRPWLGLAGALRGRDAVFQVAAHARERNAPVALLAEMLHRLPSHDLVLGLAEHRDRAALLLPVCSLLEAREPGRSELHDTREALFGAFFLIEAAESALYAAPDRLRAYSILLRAAYPAGDRSEGGGLTAEEVAELLDLDGPPLFVAAVLDAAAEDAVLPIVLDQMRRRLGEAGLEPAVVERVLRRPYRWINGRPHEERPPRPEPPVEHDPEVWSLS
ncbi:hypothetical protein [Actinomadura verrucosospora]|uniref:Uncharacterized protein n=1 Tax=Actinomadura verrucosospora TaxID=46165 RepID=A0A7D3VY50_ACTVE|nr:hypothetical protein [Actinomadura verrucosospora]QKG25630.1 hypothetical protein ACTIVE_7282 [Actinomadura verrucosospora]